MEGECDQALNDITVQIKDKLAAMTVKIVVQNVKCAQTLRTGTFIVYQGVADARFFIIAAYAMVNVREAQEKELSLAINYVWNYDRQHAFNVALTEARRVADETYSGYRAAFQSDLEKVLIDWEAFFVAHQADLDVNNATTIAACEEINKEKLDSSTNIRKSD